MTIKEIVSWATSLPVEFLELPVWGGECIEFPDGKTEFSSATPITVAGIDHETQEVYFLNDPQEKFPMSLKGFLEWISDEIIPQGYQVVNSEVGDLCPDTEYRMDKPLMILGIDVDIKKVLFLNAKNGNHN